MATYKIQLTPEAQTFTINLAGVAYQIYLYWSHIESIWIIEISDTNGNPILQGIPLVANTDLLEQYDYLNFGGTLIAQTDGEPDIPAAYENLGVSSHLYFVTP